MGMRFLSWWISKGWSSCGNCHVTHIDLDHAHNRGLNSRRFNGSDQLARDEDTCRYVNL